MQETAINVPFEAAEIIDIAKQEFEKRLRGLSPLSGSKEYSAFSLDFQVTIRLRRAGEPANEARETLAWGNIVLPSAADLDAVAGEMERAADHSTFESKEPNEEREDRNMPMTVESGDGRGGKQRRKVRIKA